MKGRGLRAIGRFLKKNRLDNRGGSMVASLVAIAFVSVLSAVVMTSTIANYRLRVMNYKAKQTFYNAESALEEVYSGVSTECYEGLKKEYLNTLKNLVVYDESKNGFKSLDNSEANEKLRQSYLAYVKSKLNIENTNLKVYLQGFISDENAKIMSVGDVTSDIKTVTVNDLLVEYTDPQGSYYSTVSVDMVVDYPDVTFDFINEKNNLKTYLDYCLIGMNGVSVNQNVDATVSGGIYAGSGMINGLMVNGGANLKLVAGTSKTVIVTNGDVTDYGSINVTSGSVWAENLNIGDPSGRNDNASLTFATDKNTFAYLADDLNIQGNESKVTLGKHFYGYSYSATTTGNSSAIVVNGTNSSLDATSLSNLILGGRAYVNVGTGYMTADSVGIKGSQYVYLVPTNYMNVPNPSIGNPGETPVNTKALKEFFAYSLLAETPYVTVSSKDGSYYYLNFKDTASQIKYISAILNKTNIDESENFESDWAALDKIVKNSVNTFIKDDNLKVTAGNVLTTGSLLQAGGNGYKDTAGAVTSNSNDTFIKACTDKDNRAKVLNQFLYDMGTEKTETFSNSMWSKSVRDGDVVEIDDEEYTLDYSTNIYDFVIDSGLLQTVEDGLEDASKSYDVVSEKYQSTKIAAVVVGNVNYEVPAGITGGVILGYDANIVVNNDFEGLIFTNGQIFVANDAKLEANRGLSDTILRSHKFLGKYFKAYQHLGELSDIRPEDISKEDLLRLLNWRKNYVETATSEEATE